MKILGIDTATAACSVALLGDESVLAAESEPMQHGHAQVLVPMLLRVMQGHEFGSLDAFGVTCGPGGFTGIRVGLSTARALGLAARRPVFGVSTFAAIVWGLPLTAGHDRKILVLVESKRPDLYAQLFSPERQPLAEPAALRVEDLAAYAGAGPLLLAGDGAVRAASSLGSAVELAPGSGRPDAAVVAGIAMELLRGQGPPSVPPRAFYLKAPDVTAPRKRS
jgi:tRNA threonylcarbamoyladenosine biosynthesis protein TsaB